MLRLMLSIVAFCLLGGCATRGALTVDCPRFRDYIVRLPPSALVQDIQADAGRPGGGQALAAVGPAVGTDPLGDSLAAGAGVGGPVTFANDKARRDVLLLSGGGQWGAFGAGFLTRLRATHPDGFPRVRTITGISTGGLQSLFLAVGDDAAMAEMLRRYQPAREPELVDRNAQWKAAITGSLAGLKPLRRAILGTLCTGGDPGRGCPMIDALAAEGGPDAFIGFVDAETGEFHYAPVRVLARLPDRREAQQCIAGAALASAAMPVFFQQVRVGGRTFYDGGVRQSVFEVAVAGRAFAAASAANAPTPPTLFVVRNGPTVLAADPERQSDAAALGNALRAEAIIVNQLEVQSIADLRLAHPTGPIRLVTADGFDKGATPCVKARGGVMFDPAFMRCLRHFGEQRAERDQPWRELGELLPGTSSAELRLKP